MTVPTAKSSKKTKPLVPKLRFPEFSGEWEVKKLSDFFNFKNGINAPKESYGSGYKFINVLDIIQNDFITHDKIIGQVNISEKDFFKNIVEYGDILFQRSSETREEVGQANVYLDKEKTATFGGFVIRGKKINDYEPCFMNFLLKTANARKEITSKSGGSTRYNVGQAILNSVKIRLPKLPEQTKIANFLLLVDKKISLLQQQQTALETYKKGLLQQIFSQQLRFKDDNGADFPDWEEKKIDNLVDKIIDNRGKTPPLCRKGIPLIEINAIGKKQIDYTKVSKYISNETYDNWFRKYLKDKDLLFSTVGKTAICSIYSEETIAAIAQNIVGLRFKNVNRLFMFYLFTEPNNNNIFKRIEMGAVQPSIKVSQMIHLKFNLPSSIKEQTKIANFLSLLDKRIENLQQQVAKTQELKKGLLQQMFP